MNRTTTLSITGVGGLLTLISFFLPWVSVDLNPLLEDAIVPLLRSVRPEILEIITEFTGLFELSGYDTAFAYNFLPGNLKFVALLPSMVVFLALLGVVLQGYSYLPLSWVSVAISIISFIAIVILILNLTSLGTLGLSGNPLIAIALAAVGFEVGGGFWGSLLGLLILSIGSALTTFATQSSRNDLDLPASPYDL